MRTLKRFNKKGMLGGIQEGGQAFLYLMLIIVLIGAVGVFGAKFTQDNRDDVGKASCAARTDGFTTYNYTRASCQNSTNSLRVVTSTAFVTGNESLNSLQDVAQEQTTYTSAAILGIVLLILVGVIGYFVALGRGNQ